MGDMSIVIRLWRAAMGRETLLFKGISKGGARTNAGTLRGSWFGKIRKGFVSKSCSMAWYNDSKSATIQKLVERILPVDSRRLSQMTFRSFPNLKSRY